MSVCDGSQVMVVNLTGGDISASANATSGTNRNPPGSNPSILGPGVCQIWYVYSGSGTNGNCAGNISIQINGVTMRLPYAFSQSSGVCTPSSQASVSNGNYVANVTLNNQGQNQGQSATIWQISSTLIPVSAIN